jgi:hypothetical protein
MSGAEYRGFKKVARVSNHGSNCLASPFGEAKALLAVLTTATLPRNDATEITASASSRVHLRATTGALRRASASMYASSDVVSLTPSPPAVVMDADIVVLPVSPGEREPRLPFALRTALPTSSAPLAVLPDTAGTGVARQAAHKSRTRTNCRAAERGDMRIRIASQTKATTA